MNDATKTLPVAEVVLIDPITGKRSGPYPVYAPPSVSTGASAPVPAARPPVTTIGSRSTTTESGALRIAIPPNSPPPTVEIEQAGSAEQGASREAMVITGYVYEYQDSRDGKPLMTPTKAPYCIVKVAGLSGDNRQSPHSVFYCYHQHLHAAASLTLGEIVELVAVAKVDQGKKRPESKGIVWQSIEDVRSIGAVAYQDGKPVAETQQ